MFKAGVCAFLSISVYAALLWTCAFATTRERVTCTLSSWAPLIGNESICVKFSLKCMQSHTCTCMCIHVCMQVPMYMYMYTQKVIILQVDAERTNLLKHPVAISLLTYKWETYGRYIYYGNLLIYILFLSFLTTFALVVPHPETKTCELCSISS